MTQVDWKAQAQALAEGMIAQRRDFHRHPELGFQEVRTSGIVADTLRQLEMEIQTGVGKTGVVGILEGAHPGKTVLLRFDMDALPIHEETGAEYASQTPGVMHACGHDGHTSIGLTVAKMLHAQRHQLGGTYKFVFQPAEEGLGGAKAMLEDGVLHNPRPDLSLALHLWNDRPHGDLCITAGPVMSASETFTIRLIGKGGHGAHPSDTIDPVIASAHIINALQTVVSRNVDALESAVISVTRVRAGEAFNVIPSEAELRGTIRTYKPAIREVVMRRFEQVVRGVGEAMGCGVEITTKKITPPVYNDKDVTTQIQQVAGELYPQMNLDTDYRSMGSEDMAYMMDEIPGCYFFVGSADRARGLDAPHHHPKFDVDEQALVTSAALMAAAAVRLAGRE